MTRPTNNKFILPIITFIIFLGIWEMVIIIGHYQPVLLPGPALVGKSMVFHCYWRNFPTFSN